MIRPCTTLSAAVCALLALPIFGGTAVAQTASQLQPEAPTAPPPSQPPLETLPTVPSANLPSDLGSLHITPRRLTIDNPPPGTEAQSKALLQTLQGRTLDGQDIVKTLASLQDLYSAAGFALVRVILPPKGATDEELRFLVVDGFIERVTLDGVPPRLRPRVRGLLQPLVGQSWMRSTAFFRQLSLVNEMAGGQIAAALTKGIGFGGVNLQVIGRAKPVAAWLATSKSQSPALGPLESVAGVEISNLAGGGEQLLVQASGDFSRSFLATDPRYRALLTRLSLPLGTRGLVADFSYTSVSAQPTPTANTLPTVSGFRKASASLRYPWLISENRRASVFVSAEAMTDQQDVAGHVLGLSLDKTRVVRAGIDLTGRRSGWPNAWQLRLTQSVGIDALGARSAAQATPLLPLSRQGADAHFWKLEVQGNAVQPLGRKMSLRLQAQAQTGYGAALLRAEQIGLAQNDGLSNLAPGALQGDDGAVARIEVSRIAAVHQLAADLYGFGAAGIVHVARPTALEQRDVRGAALGGGMRAQIFLKNGLRLSATGEYAAGWRSDAKSGEQRLRLGLQISY
ncbi:MAG: ShlB/FhaC/HecB family hemolysin secretion/activation protein [Chakrabartia sp.]